MTDRLTEAELDILSRPGRELARIVLPDGKDDEVRCAVVRVDMLDRAIAELRSLRTRPAEPQGLTEEEREALKWLRSAVSFPCLGAECHCSSCLALAALDRLIGAEARR